MTAFTVTTYQPMSKKEYRARIHGDVVPLVETQHTVDAADALEAIRKFPDFCGIEATTKSQFSADAHSQLDSRTGRTGVYAVLA
ncbi:hypothetical protein EET67_05090 [Pseudaminobacter arsenicus]|uniref:Uncharacterized protein n=1 Tax=Borborobacter arsenicus TaxID=1851146 RepID=A0A432VA15_9HYPH|nr:hypothetical protein [Pseudaminobacter arsenicus]RUM99017.1 hypothetical protein EET67_05090 [Pseudaminobacter arsenicus]